MKVCHTAAGLPVVATDVGGTREIVVPDYGILVPPGDVAALAEAVASLAADPAGRRRMGEAARARFATDFDIGVGPPPPCGLRRGGCPRGPGRPRCYRGPAPPEESRLPVSVVIAPIVEDRLDDWREFHSDLSGPRRAEWAQSQRRRGITREVAFLWSSARGPAAVYVLEGAEAGAALEDLGAGDDPFDTWMLERLADLHPEMDFPVRIGDTRPPEGARGGWRGLVSRRRRP